MINERPSSGKGILNAPHFGVRLKRIG